MSEEIIYNLTEELREGYNIPPFISDKIIRQEILEADAYFKVFVNDIDYDVDYTARKLLKIYCWYSHNGMIDAFKENYSTTILEWQVSKLSYAKINQ